MMPNDFNISGLTKPFNTARRVLRKSCVFFLMGPTCSGKTALAIELAKRFPIAIINVDSAQVYKGMDIGTAKPDAKTLKEFPHRLIDIYDPAIPYNASNFCTDAKREIDNIIQEGKIPLLVGGTMLYFKALKEGLAPLPEADPDIRKQILEEAEKLGWPTLHERLQRIDPDSAAKIKPNDSQRIGRALEIYEMTGDTLSALQQVSGEKLTHPVHMFGLIPNDRARLHALIEERFDIMLAQGFIDEVKTLYARGDLNPNLPAIKSVGYRQAWEFLSGNYDAQIMREKAIAATRQLAKRQITWLRSWPDLIVVDPFSENNDDIIAKFSRLMHIE